MQHIFWAMEKIPIFFREYRTFTIYADLVGGSEKVPKCAEVHYYLC